MLRDNINYTDHNILGINEWRDFNQIKELWTKARSSYIQSTINLNIGVSMRLNDREKDNLFLRSSSLLSCRAKLHDNFSDTSKNYIDLSETQSKRPKNSRYACSKYGESKRKHQLMSNKKLNSFKHLRMTKTPVHISRKNSTSFNFGTDYRRLKEEQREQIREVMRKTVIEKLSRIKCKPVLESTL